MKTKSELPIEGAKHHAERVEALLDSVDDMLRIGANEPLSVALRRQALHLVSMAREQLIELSDELEEAHKGAYHDSGRIVGLMQRNEELEAGKSRRLVANKVVRAKGGSR